MSLISLFLGWINIEEISQFLNLAVILACLVVKIGVLVVIFVVLVVKITVLVVIVK